MRFGGGKPVWLPAEDEALRRYAAAWPRPKQEEIALAMGRSLAAVRTRIVRLGLSFRAPSGSNGPFWSDDEVATLMRLRAGGAAFVDIAATLGRSAAACRMKHDMVDHYRSATRRPGSAAADPRRAARPRRCLRCRREFPSAHCGHRICDGCKHASAFDLPPQFHSGLDMSGL